MSVAMIVLAVLTMALQVPRSSIKPSDDELIHVDGSKNPELIPQWSAWELAFRMISGGTRQLPTMVLLHVSEEEAAMVLEEATAAQKLDVTCEERMSRLRPLIGKEKPAVLDAKAREIILDCRWQVLRTRDRVLKGLNPEGQAAMVAFVEGTKAGTRYTMKKSELARFLEPE